MTDLGQFPLLDTIHEPADLRRLPAERLSALADELREYLIQSVSRTGGHFAGGLGVLELTVALHYVYNTPHDRLVWDVGHQSYPHKILTGRRGQMATMRRYQGLAGFPKRGESPFDTFGVGHSSTSIGAALGMAIAAQQSGSGRKAVAIIGDGGMTAGMAFEALNHGGILNADLLVILNDNEMSISPNVGALSSYLTRIMSGGLAHQMRENSKRVLQQMPSPMQEIARRAEEHMKGMIAPVSNVTLFEEMGFHYYGPIDGHDMKTLLDTLNNMKALPGPKLLHVITRKGKGYKQAEEGPVKYHAVSVFDPSQGMVAAKPAKPAGPTYTQVFGDWLCDMADHDQRLVGITPAMREGSGMVEFSQRFARRYFDVAIAEQHSVTVAAGMACDGLKPVVAIYSTFLQRAYDQLIHDVAIQNLPVLFAIDRAGLVGPDGPTHAGSFDLSFMRCIPNMVIMAPADENECRHMLSTGFALNQPVAVRYPRGKGPGVTVDRRLDVRYEVGKSEIRRQGQGIALLAFGTMVAVAEQIADELNATVVNMRFIKPLDEAMVKEMALTHQHIVTLEENAIPGGAGAAILEYLASQQIHTPVSLIGLPDRFIDQGEREQLLTEAGLDASQVLDTIKQRCVNALTASSSPSS